MGVCRLWMGSKKVICKFKMKKIRYQIVIALAAGTLLLGASCQSSNEQTFEQPERKVLFVIVDGIPPDVIERVSTPWIDEIASHGGYTRAYTGGEAGAYSESPTISAVCYTHLVTGTWTNKHNVWDNSLREVNFNYPSAFWYLKNQYPEKTIAIFSTWEDNRTKLIGEGIPETGNLIFDFSADGYELDTLNYPHDNLSNYIHEIDERVSEEAAATILNDAPHMSWVYLQYTDDIGHKFGDSEQMDSAVVKADNQVGRMWEAVKQREKNHNEEWLVYIVTDHGRDDQGYHHGGQSPRERGIWFSTNDKNLNDYFHDATPGLVDVLPSILRFLDIEVPQQYRFEMDGVPLSGELSHVFTEAQIQDEQLTLAWDPYKNSGNLKIWLATTNDHREGGKDEYFLLGEVPVSEGKVTFDVSTYPSEFHKVVLESAENTANRWVDHLSN